MDSVLSIIDHQRTYYFNGTYDEVLSYDQPKPPPMLTHGDDIHAVPKRTNHGHGQHRTRWSERRKNRDKKRKRMASVTADRNASATASNELVETAAEEGNVDDDEAREALPASEIPDGFPEELVFRALAAYATMRTLSVQLRLSPFTPTAFLRAIYLPFPNRLMGSIHVHILRILLHNLQMGYNWKDSTTVPPPLDIVKKRKIDHIKWPLRAGDDLRYLDMHSWPIFYDDYCHLTADIVYASLHDIRDHVDARSLHLAAIIDTFSTSQGATDPYHNSNGSKKESHMEHYIDTAPPNNDDSYDIIVIDSDDDYKAEEDEDDEDDAFQYDDDDDSFGRSKKKKRKSKTKRQHNVPKYSTTTNGTTGDSNSNNTNNNTNVAPTTVMNVRPQQQQQQQQKQSNGRSFSMPTTRPPHYTGQYHPQHPYNQHHHQSTYPHYVNHPSTILNNNHQPPLPLNKNHQPPLHQNVSPFRRQTLPNQHAHYSVKQYDPRDRFSVNPSSSRHLEQEPLRKNTTSHDNTSSYQQFHEQPTANESSQHRESTVPDDNDSTVDHKEIIVIDITDSPSVTASVDKPSGDTSTTTMRSRRLSKATKKSKSFAGSKELHFFQERYGLKTTQDEPLIPSSDKNIDGGDDAPEPNSKRRLVDNIHKLPQLEYSDPRRVNGQEITNTHSSYDRGIERKSYTLYAGTAGRHERTPYYMHTNDPESHDPNNINHGGPTGRYNGYESYPMHPQYRPPDFYTWTNPVHDAYASNICPPSPIKRSDSTSNNIDEKDDNDVPLANCPVESSPPLQRDMSAASQAEQNIIVASHGNSIDTFERQIMPYEWNTAKSHTTCDQKKRQFTDSNSTTAANGTPTGAETIRVSEPSRISSSASHRPETASMTNVYVSDNINLDTSLNNSSTGSRYYAVASQLQTFIRGQCKSMNATSEESNEGENLPDTSTDDSVIFSMNESDNWSQFSPLKAMRMGAPYHSLTVNDKLAILEFLIDELLSVEWVAAEFTSRHDYNAQFEYPYGPQPSVLEMKAVKDADGEEHDELCKVCNEIGDVVCCDGCVSVYHGGCAGFLNASKLPDIWYCPECAVKDPSSFGPLRGRKKSEVDWFTVDDITKADKCKYKTGQDDLDNFRSPHDMVNLKLKLLTIHGYAFCNVNLAACRDDNMTSVCVKHQAVLGPKKVKDILSSLGQVLCLKWPIEQIPINSTKMWKSEIGQDCLYFTKKEFFDPNIYDNKYRRAPILLEGVRRSKESEVAEEKILNDVSTVPGGMSNLFSSDVSKDGGIMVSISSNPLTFDAQEVIKNCMLKIESDLTKALLLDEFWNAREMSKSAVPWKQSVKTCMSLRCLSRLLLRLVDATHHRAFLENWNQSTVVKPKEGVPARQDDVSALLSNDFTPHDEKFRKYWERSLIHHLPTLLSKTAKYSREIGQKSRPTNINKRKATVRKSMQYVSTSSNAELVENDTPRESSGDVIGKLRNRRESVGTKLVPSLPSLQIHSQLDGVIRSRMQTFTRESKQLIHREIHWPVAGKKLFDPLGYIPATSVRYLGRTGGALFAPFVDYSTLHEVGQVAYCHVWRKRVFLCSQFEHLTELVRILVMHLNQSVITKCASLAQGGKFGRGKNSIAIISTQRDLLTGLDYHLLGIPVPTKGTNRVQNRWESSLEIDLGLLLQEHVRRSKAQVEAVKNQTLAETNKNQETLVETNTGSSGAGNENKNAATLAANIISVHIEETKKLFQLHGSDLSTKHMIPLRKKTDDELSRVIVGNLPYVDENGRVEMMMKAENSAREFWNGSIRPQSNNNQSNGLAVHHIGQSQQHTVNRSIRSQSNNNLSNGLAVQHIGQSQQHTVNLEPTPISSTPLRTPTTDLSRIMATGTPFEWSKKIVQQHKDFARFLYFKHGKSSFPDSELDASRRQCIFNLNSIFQTTSIRYSIHQVSAVIAEAENEARADFIGQFLPHQQQQISSSIPSHQLSQQYNAASVPSHQLSQQYNAAFSAQSRDTLHPSQSYQQQWLSAQQQAVFPSSASMYGQQQQQQSYNLGIPLSSSSPSDPAQQQHLLQQQQSNSLLWSQHHQQQQYQRQHDMNK